MPTDSDAGKFAGLVTDLAAQEGEMPTTDRIVARAVDFSPDTDYASLTIKYRRSYKTLATTSELAADLDAAQYRLNEGPCVASADHGDWYRSGDIGNDPRWPRWGPEAARRGIHSLLAVQILADGRPFGALNHYSTRAGAFDNRDDIEMALIYAVHAANAIASAKQVAHLETALSTRHDIGIAQGFLMAKYGMSAEASFAAMTRISQNSNVKLRQVARDVMQARRLPGEPDLASG